MVQQSLLRLAGTYGFVGGGLTTALLYPLTLVVGVSFPGTALFVGMGSLIVGPLLVATSDAGLDTATAGGMAGFQDITDPSKYQPGTVPIPGRVELACYLVGLGICCLAAVGLFV